MSVRGGKHDKIPTASAICGIVLRAGFFFFFPELLKGVGRQSQIVKETKQIQNETTDLKKKKMETVVMGRRCKHNKKSH